MARVVCSEEFKIEAVKQVTKNDYSTSDIAQKLGVHTDTLRS
ncbi:MAG: transposase [Thiovulaceae bacterium]|nr:transposase [Sulfurimonadaceae bacterium]